MLIQQLRDLERDGVVARKVFNVVPPRVEYSLTVLGERLCPALNELIMWAGETHAVERGTSVPAVAYSKD